MRTIWSTIERAVLVLALGAVTTLATAGEQTPTAVELSGSRLFQQNAHRLYEANATQHEVRLLRVSAAFKHTLASASSIVFPVSHSQVIDGKEFVLVVVNQASSSNPTGFCGVGEEGTLYVLELHDLTADPRFSLPVQSCLKTIDLSSDGVKSPYSAISWSESPVGLRVSWQQDAKGNEATHTFRYENGKFVEATP
ncbi:hypothetical protein EOS_27945 [Caballeronia mineralivorans PML1(12)]|uniref:Lipoprotein n=1 Tax=Caballeronia mineralivorans PML1(12) TaxID=908627 RepID=A0A0J1CQN9_9BURK|nr:hypothetical protein [Caballeronia mineralivorans]KLU22962.1 hypothetical protein EOS_27945 [Caballeronia mineralivorans PML1(12)]